MEATIDRSIIYDQAQTRDYDVLYGWKRTLYALGQTIGDVLGDTGTVVSGLGATSNSSLNISLAAGEIYSLSAVDGSAFGSISADSALTMQQGFAAAQSVLLSTSGISSGQSRYTLIQATFSQADDIPSDDPNAGVLNYLNAANPSGTPWSGPNNSGAAQNTRRKGVCVISTVNGAPATTGSEVPPNPSGGAVGLYLIDLAFGQTVVTQPQILVAGPSAGANVPGGYAAAPFLAGLEQKNTIGTYAGNPNGHVAGTVVGSPGTLKAVNSIWDTVSLAMWECSASGSALTAVWSLSSGGSAATYTRFRLQGNFDLYVNGTTGNDNNSGLTSGSAFLTLQKAWNYIQTSLDLFGHIVTVHCTAAGPFLTGVVALGALVGASQGAGSVVFQFDAGTSVQVAAGSPFVAISGAAFTVQAVGPSLSLTGAGSAVNQGYGVFANNGGQINIGANVVFGTCTVAPMGSNGVGANVTALNNVTITGGAQYMLYGVSLGQIVLGVNSAIVVTVTGTPAFSVATASVSVLASIVVNLASFSGSATGPRYAAAANGVINTNAGGVNFFPGNASGTTTTGGQYI